MITVQTLTKNIATYIEDNVTEQTAMRQARELSHQNRDVTFYVKVRGNNLAIYRNGYML